jgi:60S ribosomal subunit assembly/export protein LOC1
MLSAPTRRTKTQYSAEELGVPTLNSIIPAGVQKPKGVKKGKVFVDDQEQMMMILKMVEAEKSKDVESRLMRARQLEEIREARRKEMEEKQSAKKAILEETKDSLRKKRRRRSQGSALDKEAIREEADKIGMEGKGGKSKRKRVSFG